MNMRLAQATLILGLAFAAGTAQAATNLVTNGNFDNLTNGYGQVVVNPDGTNRTSGTYTSSANGWYSYYTADNKNSGSTAGYPFIFYTNNASAGFGDAWDNGQRYLWTSSNGGTSTWDGTSQSAGGVTGGGNYVVMDGGYHTTALSQNIAGLVSGTTYTLSFLWAAAQWSDGSGGFATGDTTESVKVSIDGKNYTTDTVNLPSKGFSGWMAKSLTFTYGGGSNVLSFLATGTPAGLPPMTLLDSVSLSAVPEPGTLTLAGLAVAATLVTLRRRRKAA